MRPSVSLAIAAAFTAGCSPASVGNAQAPTAVPDANAASPMRLVLVARDGVRVFGTYYAAAEPKALILLFHQAGSGKGEYADIAPRLVAAGYSALAIDQRAGGGMFGKNETAVALGRAAGYLDALPDLQAALDWANGKDLPIVLWGSSYSSSLIFRLAADNPGKVKALLAFSPGEYFDDKSYVRTAAAKITAPAFITSAADPDEVALAKTVFDAAGSRDKVQYVPKAGVHGSSTLIATRNPKGADANWSAALDFLKRTIG